MRWPARGPAHGLPVACPHSPLPSWRPRVKSEVKGLNILPRGHFASADGVIKPVPGPVRALEPVTLPVADPGLGTRTSCGPRAPPGLNPEHVWVWPQVENDFSVASESGAPPRHAGPPAPLSGRQPMLLWPLQYRLPSSQGSCWLLGPLTLSAAVFPLLLCGTPALPRVVLRRLCLALDLPTEPSIAGSTPRK